MSFVEVRLPVDVERGAVGGPSFNTTVATLASGHEKRNQNWSQTRGRWNVGYGIQIKENLNAVIAFFYARRGRAIGFRFRDWSDYQVLEETVFGTGDAVETDFQIKVRYEDSGSNIFDRDIYKPVTGTVAIYIDGNLQTETTHYTIDYATGIVTFLSAPGDTLELTWTGEFDNPVRFDTDHLAIQMEIFNAGEVPDIPIIELRP